LDAGEFKGLLAFLEKCNELLMRDSRHDQTQGQADELRQLVVIVPAYEPGDAFCALIPALRAAGFSRTIVVNDGSASATSWRFERAAQQGSIILAHPTNRGKGEALKTAFRYALEHYADSPGVVTCDADGQHLVGDVVAVAERFLRHQSAIVLGARRFDGACVPFRNRFGNSVTRWLFCRIVGISLLDTQTGLRAIPRGLLDSLIEAKTSKYDFELEMLIRGLERATPVQEVPIVALYPVARNGAGAFDVRSHFKPVRDSLRICFVLLRFIGDSIRAALSSPMLLVKRHSPATPRPNVAKKISPLPPAEARPFAAK